MWNMISLLMITLLTTFLFISMAYAWIMEIPDNKYKDVSIQYTPSWNLVDNVSNVWTSLLTTVKVVLEGVLFIYMMIIWIQMVMSMWNDEDSLSNAKSQMRYSLVALIFMNMPWSLYNLLYNESPATVWYIWSWTWTNQGANSTNLFLNYYNFWNFLWISWGWFSNNLMGFLQVLMFWIAVMMMVIAWIKMMTASWKEELITEWKNKIIFSIMWMVLVWFMSAWSNVVFNGKMSDWTNFFSTLANLSLFFAGPVAVFFLALAWYYLITSAWDEESMKKAKTIVMNTVIATLMLLASYSFLWDLANL